MDRVRKVYLPRMMASAGGGIVGRVLPFGIGAVVGGAANQILGRRVVKTARTAFGPPPPYFPASTQPKVVAPGPRASRRAETAVAAEERRWPAERVAALSPAAWQTLVLIPACDLSLFDSPRPVDALWQMALHEGETVQDLAAPTWLALKKQPDCRVLPLSLSEGEWRLLDGCRQGIALSALLEQDWQAAESLTRLVTLGLLVDVTSTLE